MTTRRRPVGSSYDEVLASDRWARWRRRLFDERGRRCERCRVSLTVRDFQTHHLTYEHLGDELDADLQILCRPCHQVADQERAVEAKRRSARALYAARLDGWASKRYGEDWDRGDVRDVEAAFDAWLDRHDGDRSW